MEHNNHDIEQIEAIKGEIKSHNLNKIRQYSGQEKKDKKAKNGPYE